MPTIISSEYYDCGTTTGGSLAVRKIQTVYDDNGTGILTWTLDSGALPLDMLNNFEVYQNGKRLDYLSEYTKQDFVTPTTSTITILYPVPQTYYTLIKYS